VLPIRAKLRYRGSEDDGRDVLWCSGFSGHQKNYNECRQRVNVAATYAAGETEFV